MTMIRIFITGGTIDDLEYESQEDAPQNPPSLIPEILMQANLTQPYAIEVLLQKDSRHVNEKDREIIANACKSCAEKKILITHGTMTMAETARYLETKNLNKTIVLVGSMIPANKKILMQNSIWAPPSVPFNSFPQGSM